MLLEAQRTIRGLSARGKWKRASSALWVRTVPGVYDRACPILDRVDPIRNLRRAIQQAMS